MARAERIPPHWCPACQQPVTAFGPGGPRARANAKCPHCGALERHRFLARVLDQHGPLLGTSDVILDIAPQPQVAALLRQLSGPAYVATDLFSHLAIDVRTDLTHMPLPDGSVDAVVCYHVLEHIPDDVAAMRELARILKPGGVLFLQVPWRPGVPTDEDPDAPVEERLRRFGQDDHVRYYGSDLEDRLARSGLRAGRITPGEVLSEEQLASYGILRDECMWVCRPAPPAALTGSPALTGLRLTDAASADLQRQEIDRLRLEALGLRRRLVALEAAVGELVPGTSAALRRAAKVRGRQVFRRLEAVEPIAPTLRRAAAVYRRGEAARRRRRRRAAAAAAATADRVPAVLDPADDPTVDRSRTSIAVITDPERLAAWKANATFADVDIVTTGDPGTAEAIEAGTHQVAVAIRPTAEVAAAWRDATRFALCVATPDRASAPGWGDTHFARDVQKALRRLGHPTRVYLRDEFDDPSLSDADVVVHIVGRAAPRLRRGQVNVLWIISHPDRVRADHVNGYDLVLVASRLFATRLQARLAPPVFELMQATDPARFRPDPTGPPHDILFVGNSRLTERRRIIDDLTPTRLRLAVYGRDWYGDFLDPRHLKGHHVPNDRLHAHYSSAAIVLNDHWVDMAREGFFSNRLYDALACGAFVVSDHVEGLAQEFDDGLVTYRDRAVLEPLLRSHLADPAGRRRIAERGRQAVIGRHTFDDRAQRLVQLVEPLLHAPMRHLAVAGASPPGVTA